MKNGIRYFVSRLLVLIVAIHTLDVSIDIDSATMGLNSLGLEKYDDIDSFSELLLESFYNDRNLVPENGMGDQVPVSKTIHKFSISVVYTTYKSEVDVKPFYPLQIHQKHLAIYTFSPTADFSRLPDLPPDTQKFTA